MQDLHKLVSKIVKFELAGDALNANEALCDLSEAICVYYKTGFESGYKMGMSHAKGKIHPLTDPETVNDAIRKAEECTTELIVNFDLCT